MHILQFDLRHKVIPGILVVTPVMNGAFVICCSRFGGCRRAWMNSTNIQSGMDLRRVVSTFLQEEDEEEASSLIGARYFKSLEANFSRSVCVTRRASSLVVFFMETVGFFTGEKEENGTMLVI